MSRKSIFAVGSVGIDRQLFSLLLGAITNSLRNAAQGNLFLTSSLLAVNWPDHPSLSSPLARQQQL